MGVPARFENEATISPPGRARFASRRERAACPAAARAMKTAGKVRAAGNAYCQRGRKFLLGSIEKFLDTSLVPAYSSDK
jgi:hypothetical protein